MPSGNPARCVTGFLVMYVCAEEAFLTYQTHPPLDGQIYKVSSVTPVVFQPQPGYRIDDSVAEAPVVIANKTHQSFNLNDAIKREYLKVADRWERPVEVPEVKTG